MMLSAALRYAKLGWPVLPLWWLEAGECVCRRNGACRPGQGKHEKCTEVGCSICAPGKHPIGFVCRGGVDGASTDRRVIEEWFRRYPNANVGIACERFVVIDIDPRNGGTEFMADQVGKHARLPPTPTARTGSGGWHFLFAAPDFEMRGQAGPGVDVKKRGGYIVAPPSATVMRYRWVRPPTVPLATMPPWLQSLVKRLKPPGPIRVAFDVEITLERRISRARAYLETCEPAVSGQGGSTRTFVVAQHVALGFALDSNSALLAMSEWNAKCQPPWSERELRRKIDQALQQRGHLVNPGQHLAK